MIAKKIYLIFKGLQNSSLQGSLQYCKLRLNDFLKKTISKQAPAKKNRLFINGLTKFSLYSSLQQL